MTARPMYEWWNDTYIAAAKAAYPTVTKGHTLAVGFKLSHVDGTTHDGYYWPLVNGDHDVPVLHEATDWNPTNSDACPSREGDGLCLIPQGVTIYSATSGGVSFTSGIGHVLVYPADLVKGTPAKKRAPWVIDVDCFRPVELIRLGLSGADLSGADLAWVYLSGVYLAGADLSGANLSGANLSRANLAWANLAGANLSWADLFGADLFEANLSRADLFEADLSGANLFEANLAWANLAGANLSGARYNHATRFPTGFVVPASMVNLSPAAARPRAR